MNNSFKVLGLYFGFMLVFSGIALFNWGGYRSLSYSMFLLLLLMLIQLFFGKRLAAWAIDFSIRYGK